MTRRAHAPILIAGPTASGKSALAIALAERCGGVVINADSMQVYRELRVLSARPTAEEEARVPHQLYAHVGADEAYSVARWLEDVGRALAGAKAAGQRPIIVGGTGLYFKALLEGLSPVPPIPDEVRSEWRQAALTSGVGELHRALASRDPLMAARLAPGDTQRIVRALEVIEATGRSLADWQAQKGEPVVGAADAVRIVVRPARAELHERCDRRFMQMMAGGALEEVRGLLGLRLADTAPAMRALGVRPLAAHLAGDVSIAEAETLAQRETRQYVKRQETWLARNMSSWRTEYSIINCENARKYVRLIDE